MYWIGKSCCIIYKKITITHKKNTKRTNRKKQHPVLQYKLLLTFFFCYKKGFMYKTGTEHKIHTDPNVISSKALTHFFFWKTRTINQVIKRLYKQYKTFYSLKNHSNIWIVKNIINTVDNPPPVDSLVYKY